MATSIFKLIMNAETTTNTTTNPAVQQYFYKLAEAERVGDTVTIPSTLFTDSTGTSVASMLVTASTTNGYYALFLNGTLQQTSLFTVGATGSEIVITQCSTVPVSAPITLAVNNFVPSSSSTTTVTG